MSKSYILMLRDRYVRAATPVWKCLHCNLEAGHPRNIIATALNTTCSLRNKLKAHHWGMSNAGSDILNCKTIQHFFGVDVSLNNCKSNTKRHGSHASTKHILSWSITPRLLLQTGHKHLSTVIYIFCILKSLSAARRNQGKVRMKKHLR